MKEVLHEIFTSNYRLFQLTFQEGNYLWTHAGVSSWWFENRFIPFAEKLDTSVSVAELLNMAFEKRYEALFDAINPNWNQIH